MMASPGGRWAGRQSLYYILLHSTTFYYILLHSTAFYYILLHSTTFYCILLLIFGLTYLPLGGPLPSVKCAGLRKAIMLARCSSPISAKKSILLTTFREPSESR